MSETNDSGTRAARFNILKDQEVMAQMPENPLPTGFTRRSFLQNSAAASALAAGAGCFPDPPKTQPAPEVEGADEGATAEVGVKAKTKGADGGV